MRSLAYGSFSNAAVEAAIRANTVTHGYRFEILDRKFNVVGDLDTVESWDIDHSVERDHKGALTLKMGVFESLRNQTLKYLLRPYDRIKMPNHQWVEYPMGAYLWVDPERSLPNLASEEWDVTLVDQTWRLSLASPGPAGFQIRKGQKVTDVIRDIYGDHLGYADLSGIAESDETISETKWWTLLTPNTPEYGQRRDLQSQLDSVRRDLQTETAEAKRVELGNAESAASSALLALDTTAPQTDETYVTWGAILSQLQAGIGFTSPYFDWTGERPIAVPARDLAAESADHHYDTNDLSIIESLQVTPDLSAIANRVFVKASNVDGLYGLAVADANDQWSLAVADANDQWSNHPLAQKNCGDFIDVAIEDSTAGTTDALQARANKELAERLAKHRNMTGRYGLNPAHEPYDLVGQSWTDDPDLGTETLFTQRGMKFDFDSRSMDLDLGLVAR